MLPIDCLATEGVKNTGKERGGVKKTGRAVKKQVGGSKKQVQGLKRFDLMKSKKSDCRSGAINLKVLVAIKFLWSSLLSRWLQNMSRVWSFLVVNIKALLFVVVDNVDVDLDCHVSIHLNRKTPKLDWRLVMFRFGQAIAVFLKSTTTLVDLDLSGNNFGDSVAVLAEALKENRALKRLNLASNGIGNFNYPEVQRGHWVTGVCWGSWPGKLILYSNSL